MYMTFLKFEYGVYMFWNFWENMFWNLCWNKCQHMPPAGKRQHICMLSCSWKSMLYASLTFKFHFKSEIACITFCNNPDFSSGSEARTDCLSPITVRILKNGLQFFCWFDSDRRTHTKGTQLDRLKSRKEKQGSYSMAWLQPRAIFWQATLLHQRCCQPHADNAQPRYYFWLRPFHL